MGPLSGGWELLLALGIVLVPIILLDLAAWRWGVDTTGDRSSTLSPQVFK